MSQSLLLPMSISVLVVATWTVQAQAVLVMIHHPGIIDGHNDERCHDGELIHRLLLRSRISGLRITGGLGRGYEYEIPSADLPRWKAMIDDLHKNQLLQYYKSYKLDKYGYGLVPLPGN